MSSDEVRPLCREHGEQISQLTKAVYGANGDFGMKAKVQLLWRLQIWIVGVIGTGLGTILGFILRGAVGG